MKLGNLYNPFRYGNPVPPDRFIGRENTLHVLFGRIYNGESAVVVGGPHMGKSSLLRYMADEERCMQWLSQQAHTVIPVEFDGHTLPVSYQPHDFWKDLLLHVVEYPLHERVQAQVGRVMQNNYGASTLERFFKQLARHQQRVVLLVDEFEALLHNPNLNNAEFLGALRSLSSKTDGLALIAASRLPVAELNRRSSQIIGSPFFNFCIDVLLPPLSPAEIGLLLDTALHQSDVSFSTADSHYIQRMSGRHPFLAQASAAALFEATRRGGTGNDRYTLASTLIQGWAGAHFDERWRYLSERAQQVLRTLAQAETRTSGGQMPRDAGVVDIAQYSHELRSLEP
jgi:hypothetical protein